MYSYESYAYNIVYGTYCVGNWEHRVLSIYIIKRHTPISLKGLQM